MWTIKFRSLRCQKKLQYSKCVNGYMKNLTEVIMGSTKTDILLHVPGGKVMQPIPSRSLILQLPHKYALPSIVVSELLYYCSDLLVLLHAFLFLHVFLTFKMKFHGENWWLPKYDVAKLPKSCML